MALGLGLDLPIFVLLGLTLSILAVRSVVNGLLDDLVGAIVEVMVSLEYCKIDLGCLSKGGSMEHVQKQVKVVFEISFERI